MSSEQSMTHVITQVAIEAARAAVMAVRGAETLIDNARLKSADNGQTNFETANIWLENSR